MFSGTGMKRSFACGWWLVWLASMTGPHKCGGAPGLVGGTSNTIAVDRGVMGPERRPFSSSASFRSIKKHSLLQTRHRLPLHER